MFASLHRWVQGILDANIAEPPKAALRCALVCNKTRCTPEEFKRCKARLDYVGLKRDNWAPSKRSPLATAALVCRAALEYHLQPDQELHALTGALFDTGERPTP